ncbi:hypothetical protein SARC_10665 [Sphaeroforma arctica JP610]|uniref:Uncharacterized protein n=1 Tax=Sphaeroforma arctica JP610 TaxID=667725 RepID=A0A0L0FLF5_9EUKA|nr:hypothetical protein SARC_10665 [Sphaeroforma arctica JP610]KNC76858.1 hypothetical protein SARC_10665 [Sphaeroforma arctica JP610]|eukprot:XP_014150760.1 hypothetical protein SARC_10665 [Sphaeroforma arctica JP610]
MSPYTTLTMLAVSVLAMLGSSPASIDGARDLTRSDYQGKDMSEYQLSHKEFAYNPQVDVEDLAAAQSQSTVSMARREVEGNDQSVVADGSGDDDDDDEYGAGNDDDDDDDAEDEEDGAMDVQGVSTRLDPDGAIIATNAAVAATFARIDAARVGDGTTTIGRIATGGEATTTGGEATAAPVVVSAAACVTIATAVPASKSPVPVLSTVDS